MYEHVLRFLSFPPYPLLATMSNSQGVNSLEDPPPPYTPASSTHQQQPIHNSPIATIPEGLNRNSDHATIPSSVVSQQQQPGSPPLTTSEDWDQNHCYDEVSPPEPRRIHNEELSCEAHSSQTRAHVSQELFPKNLNQGKVRNRSNDVEGSGSTNRSKWRPAPRANLLLARFAFFSLGVFFLCIRQSPP
jgi:hypothetical protein